MNYEKITKAKARKYFNEGKEIFLHTNKLSWSNPWQNPIACTLDKNEGLHPTIKPFDNLINSYSYYNCDNERGNIVIYLIKS